MIMNKLGIEDPVEIERRHRNVSSEKFVSIIVRISLPV